MEEREIFSSLRDESTLVWEQVDDLKLRDLRNNLHLSRCIKEVTLVPYWGCGTSESSSYNLSEIKSQRG